MMLARNCAIARKSRKPSAGIGPPIVESLFLEPVEGFSDGVITLVRVAVLIIEARDLVRCHLIDWFGAIKSVRHHEALVDVVTGESAYLLLLHVVPPVVGLVVQVDVYEAARLAESDQAFEAAVRVSSCDAGHPAR